MRVLPLVLLLSTSAALAQAPPGRPAPKDWGLSVGLAPIYAPIWQGSRDYGLSVFPDLRFAYKDRVAFSIPDGLTWNVVNRDGWKLGPVVTPRFGRRERNGGSPFLVSGRSDALRGLGNVDFAAELGGFAQYNLTPQLRARAEVRRGFGGHEGVVAETTLGWQDRAGDFFYGLNANASFANAAFTNVYFGVTPGQAAESGLPTFRTGSGLVSAGVSGTLTRPLGRFGRDGAVTLITSYDRLGDVVGDSSLLRQRGRRDQLLVGLSYSYRFSWN